MPYIIALLGMVGGAIFWIWRMRMAAEMTHELAGVASDVMAAARRLGFRRRLNLHPVESVDDPKLAMAGLGIAFLELGGLPTKEQQDGLLRSLQTRLGQTLTAAEEAVILGRWLVSECGGAAPAVDRLARRLVKLDRPGSLEPLMNVLNDIVVAGRDSKVSDRQREALGDIARLYKLG
ncbi:MAG: hypothetical protein ACKVPY_04365 [Paracoccaceae bacterium]